MNITLVVNTRKEDANEYASIVEQYLLAHEVHVKILTREDYTRDDFTDADYIISIGGDGTILRLAGILRGQDTPMLGINAGHLGYLTEVSKKEQIPAALQALLEHNYIRDVRTMLHGSIRRNGEVIARGTALNEILISRGRGISVLRFSVYYDGQLLSRYTSDGVIFSTPTGSTAYNLSAGGPIVAPGAPVMVMTPICAHTMNGRAVILPEKARMEIHIESENEVLAFDGENIVDLEPGDIVKIRQANELTTLVKLRHDSFLETLREKIDSENRR
ncbi:MAG TPA: N-acetylmuramoyl-L-alanine amidase [Oribacterium sp.]|jgi:NAD+ kinase|nr:N-acetylmuramoyl-L-alanine amidase [Oribacterium sp.]